MEKNKTTTVVVTSAMFIDSYGNELNSPSELRLKRLNETLNQLWKYDFKEIFVLDNSFPNEKQISKDLIENQEKITLLSKKRKKINTHLEYINYGPSRLEVNLMTAFKTELFENITGNHVLKISAGYTILNLDKILNLNKNGLIFRFGNPLRIKTKFCLSCFYVMPINKFFSFVEFCSNNYTIIKKDNPLEALLYLFVTNGKYFYTKSIYPNIKADFLSSNRSSESINYKIKFYIYSFLAKKGLYTIKF